MRKASLFFAMLLSAAATLFAFVGTAAVATAAAAEQSTRIDGSYQIAALNDRVCCKRGWQDWWTNRRDCRRSGGHQTANAECRDDWNNKWDRRWWGWRGGDWNHRVCCKRGRHDWWTTARECREAFGYQTANRECRHD